MRFWTAVARTRNNGIPTSRLISKTNFRDVNKTKSGARREFASVFLVTARGWRSLWVGGFGKIEEWLYLQQVQSVSVERATLRLASMPSIASSFRFLNCKLFDKKPKASYVQKGRTEMRRIQLRLVISRCSVWENNDAC